MHREGAMLYPESIDPYLCTHIIYAFAKIRNGKLVPAERYIEETFGNDKGLYERINDLKLKNTDLKVLLSIGSNSKFNLIKLTQWLIEFEYF